MEQSMAKKTINLVLAAFFMALGIILPFLTGQIPMLGSRISPMHIPILLCGFVCGWRYGLIVGFVTPLLRSVLFGMPPMIPTAAAMAFELAAYGTFTGILYRLLPKNNACVYVSLILSMILGRIVWGLASVPLYGLTGKTFTWKLFIMGGFVNAIPAIVLHIILIPAIIITLRKAKVMK
jgi:thiamine transporter ThiT